MAAIQYNRIIRKLVVAFGDMFNNIQLVRYNPNLSEAERFLIPIVYATKERYVMRLESDYNLDKKVQIALPKFSYEMTGMSYDANRKLNTNTKSFAQTNTGVIGQYNPVPYDFDFNLYLYVRNIEDASQVIEHILPYFTPDYTLKVNLIPEMGIVKDVPVILKDADHEIVYEGDREQETRMIIWTFRFTVKGFIFGKSSSANVITHSITNIYNKITDEDVVEFTIDTSTGVGEYQTGETVYQGFSYSTASASGIVVHWNPAGNILKLNNINGNFVSSQPIYSVGNKNGYKFTSYNLVPSKYAQIDIVPNPINATANSNYVANTTITEF